MGAIITLRDEVEAIIQGMDEVEYLRATQGEANIRLEESTIECCIALHIDQSTATGSGTQTHIVKTIPTEILFVYKNSGLDEKLYDIDSLVDLAEDKADEFHDRLIQSSVVSALGEPTDYECQRLEAHKKYDSILSGVLYTWGVPVPRTKYYCNGA